MKPCATLLFALACLSAGTLRAQDGLDEPVEVASEGARQVEQRTLATVLAESITVDDVAYLTRDTPGQIPEDVTRYVAKLLAEQILMASEAARRGVELNDYEVEEYWKARFGEAPDFSEDIEGTTIARQRELARWRVLTEIYLLHRVGMQAKYVRQIPPDPLLQRIVSVTPSQLKEAFRQNKDALYSPPGVAYQVWPAQDEDDGRVLAILLVEGRPPTDRRPVREAVPLEVLPEVFEFAPPLVEFLQTAAPGAVSAPLVTEHGVIVVQLLERLPGREARFEEVQERLRQQIQADRLDTAREVIVRTLELEAVYWPGDLFTWELPARPK